MTVKEPWEVAWREVTKKEPTEGDLHRAQYIYQTGVRHGMGYVAFSPTPREERLLLTAEAMERACAAVCGHCDIGTKLVQGDTGVWWHEGEVVTRCIANNIRNAFTETP